LKTLYVLRHAKAAPEAAGGDAARPLVKRGRKAARAMAEFLGGLKPATELILCSPAARTRETLEIVLPALRPAPAVDFEDRLYLASAERLFERLRLLSPKTQSVLLIGHNPGVHELALRLAIDPGPLAAGFPTAALAVLDVPGTWAELQWRKAKLRLYQAPKELDRES
jgi:phosphohistidine phosphatase